MRRTLALVVGMLCLCAPAPVVADAVAPIGNDDIASCVREVGPGELTLQAPATAESTPTDLVAAGPDAIDRSAGVDLGNLGGCPEVASGGGVTAIAGFARGTDPNTLELRVAVRGGPEPFAVPETLATVPLTDQVGLSVAVGSRGDAVVAWRQIHTSTRGRATGRILAARRTPGPGADWGAAEEVVPPRQQTEFFPSVGVATGMDGEGRATVAWTIGTPDRPRYSDLFELGVATAGPGEPLNGRRLSQIQDAGTPVLAVAPSGQALLAVGGDQTLRLYERPGGGGSFVPTAGVDRSLEGEPDHVAADIDASGAALVAWSYVDYGDEDVPRQRLVVARRRAGAAFEPPEVVRSRRVRADGGVAEAEIVDVVAEALTPTDRATLRANLEPDGRAAIGWIDARDVDGDSIPTGYVATAPAEGHYAVRALGNPCRAVGALTPFTGKSGELLTAWTDNVTTIFGDGSEQPLGEGRLHVSATPPVTSRQSAPSGPHLSVRAPRSTQKLWAYQAAELRAGCDRACDLRAFVPGRKGVRYAGGASLEGAGTARIRLEGGIARKTARRVPVVIHACSPDGANLTRGKAELRVVRRKPLPVPPVLDLHATPTAGGNVIVTWRTPFPARRTVFLVAGRVGESQSSDDPTAYASIEGRGRTRFSAVVRGGPSGRLRWVGVLSYSLEGGRSPREVAVRVRR